MMLEDDLRATLRERADEPAVQPDLLDEVRGGIRRANRRRAAVSGAGAVLAVAVAVPIAISRGPAPVPAPLNSAPADPAPGWDQPRFEMPAFPLTPGWTPPGAGTPRVGRVGPQALLAYDSSPERHMEVEVGAEPADWWNEGDDRPATVNGRPAKIRTIEPDDYQGLRPGDRYVGLRWQLADGRWVQIGSDSRNTESDVLRFARGLRLDPLAASRAQFTVASAPPGLVLQLVTRDQLCLAPPAMLSDHAGRGICVSLDVPTPYNGPSPEDERLTVGGRPATMVDTDEGPVDLTMQLDAKRLLTVSVDQEDVPLSREQLIRFAEGVTVNR